MFIKSLHLKNILSFKDTKLDLQPLNVWFIGPNGSGKSNLIDVIGLLQAVPGDLPVVLAAQRADGWLGVERADQLRNGCWRTPKISQLDLSVIGLQPFVPGAQTVNYDLQIIIHDDRVLALIGTAGLRIHQGLTRTKKPKFIPFSDRPTRVHRLLWSSHVDGTLPDYEDEPVEVDVPRGKSAC